MKSHLCFWASALLSLGALGTHDQAAGQDSRVHASVGDNLSDSAVSARAAPDAGECCMLPDGTIIELEIAELLSSKTAQRGQRFKLRVASTVYADNVIALPAGMEGFGEVVHADRARAAGKPGELLLAGRALNGPGGEIKLHGFRLGGRGENRANAAFWIPLGFFIRGGQIEIPIGTRAHAKLAGPYRFTAEPLSTDALSSGPSSASAPADRDTDASLQPSQP